MTALSLTRNEIIEAISLTRSAITLASLSWQWGKVSVLEVSLSDLIDFLGQCP